MIMIRMMMMMVMVMMMLMLIMMKITYFCALFPEHHNHDHEGLFDDYDDNLRHG